MSLETSTFSDELEKLDELHKNVLDQAKTLRDFILDEKFLTDRKRFQQKLGEFQASVVTFAGYEEFLRPPLSRLRSLGFGSGQFGPQAEIPGEKTEEKGAESSRMFWAKVILVVVGLLLTVVAIYQEWISHEVFIYFASATVGLALIPPALRAIQKFIERRRKEAAEEQPKVLENWMEDQLEKMRKKYTSAYLWVKAHRQTENLRLKMQGIDQELYMRKHQLSLKLSDEFISTINLMVTQCDRNIWSRRQIIAAAIVEAKQGATRATMTRGGSRHEY